MKIYSPLKGKVKRIEDVADEVFAEKMLGDGVAIRPSNNQLLSPIDGKVAMVFPSKHAIGLLSEDGVELLIHIGLETVNLEGRYFESFVEVDQTVKVGDKLVEFDYEAIDGAGYDIDTIIIITNNGNYKELIKSDNLTVDFQDLLLELI